MELTDPVLFWLVLAVVVVWLPPQYFDKAYARTRFPVLFMFHGGRGNNGQTLAKAIDAQNLNMSVIDSGHATPFIAVYGPPTSGSAPTPKASICPGSPPRPGW